MAKEKMEEARKYARTVGGTIRSMKELYQLLEERGEENEFYKIIIEMAYEIVND